MSAGGFWRRLTLWAFRSWGSAAICLWLQGGLVCAGCGVGEAGTGRVRRRRVFYIPGYDPALPRRYREMYRKEGLWQAEISGYALALRPKRVAGPYGWHVTAEIGGEAVEADVEVLVWSDIVQGSMKQGVAATYLQLLRTAWIYLATGALFRLMWLRKGPTVAALYPVFCLVTQFVLALAAGWGQVVLWRWLVPGWGWAVGAGLGGVVFIALLRFFQRIDRKVLAYYLMHDYAWSAQFYGAYPPELEARMARFRGVIRDALACDYDEVLVVGHSSGAILGVSILADLIREGGRAATAGGGPALAFLSLGQVIPMLSFLPQAQRLRGDLAYLSARGEITWVDVTAPGDGCAFALCDPVAVTGVAPADKRWPLVVSCAFTQTFSPERWREMRYQWFRLHFQYMCCFDRPGEYDYFKITAGPLTLAARYAGRAASKSRIERAASGYRSVA